MNSIMTSIANYWGVHMRLNIKSGVIRLENCYDLERQSFLRFLSRLTRGFYKVNRHELSLSGRDADIHATYDVSQINLLKVKTEVSRLKTLWLTSDDYRRLGFSCAQLLKRGWTKKAVETFLGAADTTVKNPHHEKAAPVRIYSLARVLTIESTEAWLDWYEVSLARKFSAVSNSKSDPGALDEKRKQVASEMVQLVHSRNIMFPFVNRDTLDAMAVANFKDTQCMICDGSLVLVDISDPRFISRVSVDMLIDSHSAYQARLDRLAVRVKDDTASSLFRHKLLSEVKMTYPHLIQEVESRMV